MLQYQVYSVHMCAPEPHKIKETGWHRLPEDAWGEAEDMGIVNPRMRKREVTHPSEVQRKYKVDARALMMVMGMMTAFAVPDSYLTDDFDPDLW